jgi:hypothetical protein
MADPAKYAPTREGRAVAIELEHMAHTHLLPVLSAAESCLEENSIPSVTVEIDGKSYLMTSSAS